MLIVWLFKSPHKRYVSSNTETKVKQYLSAVVILTLIPSIYLAYNLVQRELFNSRAREFVKQELELTQAFVTNSNIAYDKHAIEVTLIGEPLDKGTLAEIESRLPHYGLPGVRLLVHQSSDQRVDVTSLKASIVGDLYKESQRTIEEKDKTIQRLQTDLQNATLAREKWRDISQELRAQYPQIREIVLSEANDWEAQDDDQGRTVALLYVKCKMPMNGREKQRLERWLKVRLKSDNVKLIIQ